MRLTKTLAAVGLAAALTGGLVTATGTPAAALAAPNGSFEGGWTGGKLTCWNVNSPASALFGVTHNAHSGAWAGYVQGRTTAETRLELTTDRTSGCHLPVTAGQTYTLDLWQRSTAGARPVVYTYSPTAGWNRWFTGTAWPAGELRSTVTELPAMPAGVTATSIGVDFPGNSTVVLDDVALTPRDGSVLYRSSFPGTGLVTNEFAYWSPTNTRRVVSADWEMTSGSLFARSGNGYTGPIDAVSPNATSSAGTNSAVFRLNTRAYSFGNVAVSANLNIARLTSTSYTPPVAWDGAHIFLHYQSQYELYYASVARRDGHVVIKKKCKGGPNNGGSYHVLGAEVSGMALPPGTWAQVGATIRTNPNGTVTITLQRNGRTVVTATDTGVGCAPITNPGATGIRGDNAEFDFNGFTVTTLS